MSEQAIVLDVMEECCYRKTETGVFETRLGASRANHLTGQRDDICYSQSFLERGLRLGLHEVINHRSAHSIIRA